VKLRKKFKGAQPVKDLQVFFKWKV